MIENIKETVLFSGTSHPKLAYEIARELGCKLGKVHLEKFPDGEISLQIQENVRGRDVFVIQSISLDPNNLLMEVLVMVDALKRASAKSVIAVLPYFGYCRQDRRDLPRVPITARLVANMLEVAGVDRVLTMDLHAGQLEGFFNIPVDNLFARHSLISAFAETVKESLTQNWVVVAPDLGSIKLARAFAADLRVDFAIIDKQRESLSRVKVVDLIGQVEGKNVLLADDMCSTGGTLVSAAKACQEKGAKRIFAAISHGLFVGDAVQKLEQSPIEGLWVSNSIAPSERLTGLTKLKSVTVAPLFAHAIECVLSHNSISSLYK